MVHYNCPYCMAYLNVNGYVAFTVKKEHGKSGLILMSEELGDYSSFTNPNLTYEVGEKTEFFCPSCSKSLLHGVENDLVRIIKTDEDQEKHTILFSAKFGEKSTYQLSEERQLSFGEHALKYVDPDWYLKT